MNSASHTASATSSSSPSESRLALARSPADFISSTTSSAVSLLHDERVASALRHCEEAWEQAYTKTSELGLALIAARSARRYSRITGHQILSATAKAQVLAGDGQSELATVHKFLDRFVKANGITLVGLGSDEGDYGDGRKPPEG